MKRYKVPDKDLAKWIKCLDECVEIWEKRAKGECDSLRCPACIKGHTYLDKDPAEVCKCPLGPTVQEQKKSGIGSARWCCNGLWGKWNDFDRQDRAAAAVLAFIKARRAELVKRQKALKVKK